MDATTSVGQFLNENTVKRGPKLNMVNHSMGLNDEKASGISVGENLTIIIKCPDAIYSTSIVSSKMRHFMLFILSITFSQRFRAHVSR